jgi:hypothetical protein
MIKSKLSKVDLELNKANHSGSNKSGSKILGSTNVIVYLVYTFNTSNTVKNRTFVLIVKCHSWHRKKANAWTNPSR